MEFDSEVAEQMLDVEPDTSPTAPPVEQENKIVREDLELEMVEAAGQVASFEGDVAALDLTLIVRTHKFYRAPPAAGVELEILYKSPVDYQSVQPLATAVLLGTFRTDSKGEVLCALQLPAEKEGAQFVRADLYVRPVTKGWQQAPQSISIGRTTKPILERKIVVEPGITVAVRYQGQDMAGDLTMAFRESFTVTNLDTGKSSWHRFTATDNPRQERLLGGFPLVEKGRYRFFGNTDKGTGIIDEMLLDPLAPPADILIPMGEYGTISGQVVTAHGFPLEDLLVYAIAEADALLMSDPWDIRGSPNFTFPPRSGNSAVAEDGRFHMRALAAGSYRLGYASRSGNDSISGWFPNEPALTGSSSLEFQLPVTLLVLRFVDENGEELSKEATSKLTVVVEKQAGSEMWYDYDLDLEKTQDGLKGYRLVHGGRYKVLVWGKEYPLFETEILAPKSGGIWDMDVKLVQTPAGILSWSGPSRNISYRILSPEFNIQLERWSSYMNYRRGEMSASLPAGKYLLRAKGQTDGGNHGEVGRFRTRHGMQEQWVEVFPGQTTHVEFNPPRVGWLEIDLQAIGQPDSQYEGPDAFPELKQINWFGPTSFVMHHLASGTAQHLSFQQWTGGSVYMDYPTLEPGKVERPLEVFVPGAYSLEIRVPGFLLMHKPVIIEAEKLTAVLITLQGKE